MKIYLVQGDHFDVPGRQQRAFIDLDDANRAALDMVRTIAADVARINDDGEEEPAFPQAVRDAWAEDQWMARLADVQIARLAWLSYADGDEGAIRAEVEQELDQQAYLAEASECDIWISEIELPLGSYAHPVSLATMEAYRSLAAALIDGEESRKPGEAPEVLGRCVALAERCLDLDPPSDSKPQGIPVYATKPGGFLPAETYKVGDIVAGSSLGVVRCESAEKAERADDPVKPRIVINMSGGCLQGASANVPVEFLVLDFDHDQQGDDDNLIDVEQDDGTFEEAEALSDMVVINPAWVDSVFQSWIDSDTDWESDDVCPECGEQVGGDHKAGCSEAIESEEDAE